MADLFVIGDFFFGKVQQSEGSATGDEDSIFVGKEGVVPGVAMADVVDFGLDFGWVDCNFLDLGCFLHWILILSESKDIQDVYYV